MHPARQALNAALERVVRQSEIAYGNAGLPDIISDQSFPGPKSTILVLIIYITDGECGQNNTCEATAHFFS